MFQGILSPFYEGFEGRQIKAVKRRIGKKANGV